MEKINANIMSHFYQTCEEHGLKVTPQRVFIYEELKKSTNHPSIDDIYQRVREKLPNISFDTVYRTVLSFAELRLINMVPGYGGSKRFDANTTQHHHFRCVKCEKIIDFENEYYNQIQIPEELQRKFQIINKKILLEGICEECTKLE